jgi:hypothetical protein
MYSALVIYLSGWGAIGSKGTFPFEKRLLTWLQLLAKNAAHGVPIIVFPSLRSQQAKKKPGR